MDHAPWESNSFINGSGNIASILLTLEDFGGLDIAGNFTVSITTGAPRIEIIGDDNLISLVEAKTERHILKITLERNYSATQNIQLNIQAPELRTIRSNGTHDISYQGVSSTNLKLNFLGSVDFYADGKVSTLDIDINGAGDIKVKNLKSDNVLLRISGSGDVTTTALRSLSVSIFGSGHVVYFGKPELIEQNISGIGEIVPSP
jgi:putative autotransporter adhesin-like protein